MSLSIDECIETLRRLAPTIPGPTLTAIQTDLETKEAELAADRASGAPKQKTQLTCVLLDPEGRVQGDVTAFVFKQSLDADAGETLAKVYAASYTHNRLPKVKHPVRNVGEIGVIKRKVWKEVGGGADGLGAGLSLLTKEPVRVLVSRGPIPAA